jgi:glycolate oxidase iron-sulfur subunit
MRAVADGELETTRGFADEMSYCLGCLACTTACPAGVDYTTLLETARAHVEQSGIAASPKRNFVRWVTMRFLFTQPRALRAAGRLLGLYQASGLQTLARRLKVTALLPRSLRELEPQTPPIARRFSDALIAEVERPKFFNTEGTENTERKAKGVPSATSAPVLCSLGEEGASVLKKQYRVAVLTGCVQDLVFSDINRATVDVLLANGCEVVTPRAQACCGSLHAHNGDLETARQLARRQLDAINPADFDAIITNAAGCGSHLKHYDRLLAGEAAYKGRAHQWPQKVRDISEFLVEIGFRHPTEHSTFNIQRSTSKSGYGEAETLTSMLNVECSMLNVRDKSRLRIVTYHEACHLCHGQKISAQPREILRAIPGVELHECAEATWCCGSAGIYNITQPQTAAWLQQRKLGHLRATGANIVATANPGCLIQLENGFRQAGDKVEIVHPVVLLARAYAAEKRWADF